GPEHVAEELAGDLVGVGALAEAGLLGEHRAIEPVEQRAGGAADDAGLREVHVGVDEAGEDDPRAHVEDRLAGELPREGPHLEEGAVLVEANQAIVEVEGLAAGATLVVASVVRRGPDLAT